MIMQNVCIIGDLTETQAYSDEHCVMAAQCMLPHHIPDKDSYWLE